MDKDSLPPRSAWLSIKDTAERMGVSDKTIRRWIQDGKLQAEKMNGPYGEQWFIAASEVATAQEILDVVTVENRVDMAQLAHVLERHLETKNERIKELEAKIDTLVDHIQTLTQGVQEIQEYHRQAIQPPPKTWWQRLMGR